MPSETPPPTPAAPAGALSPAPAPAAGDPENPPALRYSSLGAFVRDFLCPIYARAVRDSLEAYWCPQWWRHDPAVYRLTLLWHTYEHAAREGALAVSGWMLDHANVHMADLTAPSGPFQYCAGSRGHMDLIDPLPFDLTAAPEQLFAPHPAAAAAGA